MPSKAVAGAIRILDGQIPYRDFWSMYAPGQFYAIAALFRLFGRELIVQGAAAVLISALTSGVLFVVLRRLDCPRGAALAVSGIVAGSFWTAAPEISSYGPALLCFLCAADRIVLYFHGGTRTKLVQAGICLGVAACFKHDVAGYEAVATTLALWIAWRIAGKNRPQQWLSPLKATAYLATGTLLVFLPPAMLIAWSAGAEAWQDLFVFPATDFRAVRTEPYAPLLPDMGLFRAWMADWTNLYTARDAFSHLSTWILCNLPQWVFVAGVIALIIRRERLSAATRAVAVLFLLKIPFFWMAAHVQQNTHLYSMAVFSLCLVGLAWPAPRELKFAARFSHGKIMTIAVGIFAVGLLTPAGIGVVKMVRDWPERRRLELPGTSGVFVPRSDYEFYHPIVSFVREHVPVHERIYVGVLRHDAIVIPNSRFYFLTQRKNCSRYDELHPGITDHADVQREIIADIQAHRVRCVILWKFGWSDDVLDRIKARNVSALEGLGSELLDRFISEHFEPLAQYGEYILMWRRNSPLPVSDR